MRRLLFHRDFTEYTGGHGKVWDYFRHALALGWDARVHFTARSVFDDRNPWMACAQRIEPHWRPQEADVLFLGGMDWAVLSDPFSPPRPVINLVQHVRHAWPDHPLHAFLAAPARRICVSQAVAKALQASGRVNGPIEVIPAALDIVGTAQPAMLPSAGVLVAALKAPALGHALAQELRDRRIPVQLLDHWLPRAEYLACVSAASVVVTLPHPAEGFYLPTLEAMALGVAVVTTDCIGAGGYARAGENCLMVAAEPRALAWAVEHALQPETNRKLRQNGQLTAANYDQKHEREKFARVLQSMESGIS